MNVYLEVFMGFSGKTGIFCLTVE